jgi:hypothetical protein
MSGIINIYCDISKDPNLVSNTLFSLSIFEVDLFKKLMDPLPILYLTLVF